MTSPYPPSNFGFLAEHNALFVELAAAAEHAFVSDPNTTLIKLRQLGEALARVNNLTQSILAKAFRGELTEQWRKDNPELISGENSASALLERIKAERVAKAPKKAARKKVFS